MRKVRVTWNNFIGITALLLVAGCTYGPPQERAYIENLLVRPETLLFAVAVRYERFQSPTGINAFPNGGVPYYLEQAAIVHLVDVSTNEIVEIARIEAPEDLQTSFGVHLTGWKKEQVFVQLSGCPGSECYGNLVQFRHIELTPEAAPRQISSRPKNTDDSPGTLSRAPGEETYMRVSAGSRVISVRTEDSEHFIYRYIIQNSGELVAIKPNNSGQRTR